MIHPSRLVNFFLDLQEKAKNSSISVRKIMGSKNACALELACILGRNIKCSVLLLLLLLYIFVIVVCVTDNIVCLCYCICVQVWTLFEEPKEEVVETEVLERKISYQTVIVTEITKELHLFAQNTETGELVIIIIAVS